MDYLFPPPPPRAQLARRKLAVAIRRAIRCGPPKIAKGWPGFTPGVYVAETLSGTVYTLDVAGPYGAAMLSRRPGSDTTLGTHFDVPRPPVRVVFWHARVLMSGYIITIFRERLETSVLTKITVRHELCEDCGGALLRGCCWRRVFMRGHWWLHETHYSSKKYSRKYLLFERVSSWLFERGL